MKTLKDLVHDAEQEVIATYPKLDTNFLVENVFNADYDDIERSLIGGSAIDSIVSVHAQPAAPSRGSPFLERAESVEKILRSATGVYAVR
jgi:5-keto 4-deoxyuronate isomerase